MQYLVMAIIGALAGFVATRLMGEKLGPLETVGIGILGAVVGGLLLRSILAIFGMVAGFIGAVLGAMLLIWLYRNFIARRR
ncbi:MAG: GlsB/YeaQ/YmgE family stress response membrane protein [Alphaproteobacteria bacterium]|nr:MAG: GlsB/YeaQ/YmgE family stress response membrane protein [Alphaproteobacteria bacterium]